MVTNKKYHCKKWRDTRKIIKQRDKETCRICGVFAIEVHHIRKSALYPELFYDVNNLIMLCNKCHKIADLNGLTGVVNDNFMKGEELLEYIIKYNIARLF